MHDALDEYIERYSNWGRWGGDDQCGTANHITPQMVRDAAGLVRTGAGRRPRAAVQPERPADRRERALQLPALLGRDGQRPRAGRQMWAGGPLPREMGYADDTVVLHLQSATHWDSLCHIFHRGRMFNGYPADEFTAGGIGAQRRGGAALEARRPRRAARHPALEGHRLARRRLRDHRRRPRGGRGVRQGRRSRRATSCSCGPGRWRAASRQGWGTYAGGDAPGLSFFTIPWLANRNVAAVASDTWGVEVRPNELPDSFQPFHIPTVVYMGLLLGEMFDLEALAAACADDGRYEMLVSAPPLAFTGTAGAPPGPVAIR